MNKTCFYNHNQEEVVSPLWTLGIYALIYGFIFAFTGIVVMADRYVFHSGLIFNVLKTNTYQLSYAMSLFVIPICFYPIWKNFCIRKINAFSGMSLLISLFFIMMFLRVCSDAYIWSEVRFFRFLPIVILITIIPSIFLSIPLSSKEKKYAFLGVVIGSIIVALVEISFIFPLLRDGFNYRCNEFNMFFSNNSDFKLFKGWFSRSATYCLLLTICSGWAICNAKRYKLLLWILVYCVGITGLQFSGSNAILVNYLISHFFIFLRPSILQNKKRLIGILVMLLIINATLLGVLNRNTKGRSIIGRVAYKLAAAKEVSSSFIINKFKTTNNIHKNSNVEIGSENIVSIPNGGVTSDNMINDETISNNIISEINHETVPDTVSTTSQFSSKTSVTIPQSKTQEQLLSKLSNGRFDLWRESIRQIISSPLTGTGFIFPIGSTGSTQKQDPHCLYLSIFMGTGILGGCIFLYITIRGLKDAISAICIDDELGWLGAFFIGEIIAFIFGLHIWDIFWFWFPLVALRANAYQHKKQLHSEQIQAVENQLS
jgi:O-antigen ligase